MPHSSTEKPEKRPPSRRKLRVGELLREHIALLLMQRVRDPRIEWVSITEVDVSPDLKNAKVYFSTLKEEKDLPTLMAALQKAAPFLRAEAAKKIEGGYGIPVLTFVYDKAVTHGPRMDRLIDEAIHKASPAAGNAAAD